MHVRVHMEFVDLVGSDVHEKDVKVYKRSC